MFGNALGSSIVAAMAAPSASEGGRSAAASSGKTGGADAPSSAGGAAPGADNPAGADDDTVFSHYEMNPDGSVTEVRRFRDAGETTSGYDQAYLARMSLSAVTGSYALAAMQAVRNVRQHNSDMRKQLSDLRYDDAIARGYERAWYGSQLRQQAMAGGDFGNLNNWTWQQKAGLFSRGGALYDDTIDTFALGFGAMFVGGAAGILAEPLAALVGGTVRGGIAAAEGIGSAISGAVRTGATIAGDIRLYGAATAYGLHANTINNATLRSAEFLGEGLPSNLVASEVAALGRIKANVAERLTLNQRINLKGAVADEYARLMGKGVSFGKMGPALAGVMDTQTGRTFFGVNTGIGEIPHVMAPSLRARLEGMPDDVLLGYVKTKGAGTHAEVHALNEAMLARPGANQEDFLLYVINSGGKATTRGMPIPRCPHCDYLTAGTDFFPAPLIYGR